MKSVLFLLLFLLLNQALAQMEPVLYSISAIDAPASSRPVSVEPPAQTQSFKKHAVVMLAINYSPGEIEAVRKATLARKEEFVLLPDMSGDAGKLAKMQYEAETYKSRVLKPLNIAMDKEKGAKKQELSNKVNSALMKLRGMEGSIREISANLSDKLIQQDFTGILKSKIDELEKAGVEVSSLAISAHDGGGNFFGTFGKTTVSQISELATDHPNFKANLKSVYMMGFYTATTDQTIMWKSRFPNLQMVAGYDQSAPLRDAGKGWRYIQDVMALESKIVGSKDKSKMESILSQVREINSSGTAQAVFPRCAAKESLEFYRGKVTHYRVEKFDINSCYAAQPEFAENLFTYSDYDEGKLPIPKDTGHSPLRDLYSFYRNYEFCTNAGIVYGPKWTVPLKLES